MLNYFVKLGACYLKANCSEVIWLHLLQSDFAGKPLGHPLGHPLEYPLQNSIGHAVRKVLKTDAKEPGDAQQGAAHQSSMPKTIYFVLRFV